MLVRILGAEGMIDRDAETSTFAALAAAGHTPPYYGRFANEQLEGWMEGMRPLEVRELSHDTVLPAIATKLARLHAQFVIPDALYPYYQTPSLWQQLDEWLAQALQNTYKTTHDTQRAASLRIDTLTAEFDWMRQPVLPKKDDDDDDDAKVVYCHNDVLAANLLYDDATHALQLIDFEYGGCNYACFDLANHWNEYAGGPPHMEDPRYDLVANSGTTRELRRRRMRIRTTETSSRTNKSTPG